MAIISTVHGPRPGSACSPRRASGRLVAGPSSSSPAGQRGDEREQRRAAGAGHGEGGRIELRQGSRLGEQVRQAALGIGDRLAVRDHEPRRVGARRRRRDLLAEHGAHGELGRIGRARHAPAGRCGHERGELRVARELRVDGDRVGVEVEQPPAAGDRGRAIALVGEREAAGDVVGARGERDDRPAVRQPQRAAIAAVAPLLHPGHRRRREMAEEVVGKQRRRETPGARPRVRGSRRRALTPAARTC